MYYSLCQGKQARLRAMNDSCDLFALKESSNGRCSFAGKRDWAVRLLALGVAIVTGGIPAGTWASFGFSEPTSIRADAASDPDNDFFADIRTDKKGTWMVVWYAFGDGNLPIGSEGDILFSISLDNGQSWAAPKPVNTDATTDTARDLAAQLDTDGEGNWICVWLSRRRSGSDVDVYSATYDQATDAWSPPQLVNAYGADSLDNENDEVRAKVRYEGEGKWVSVWTSTYPGFDGDTSDYDLFFSEKTGAFGAWSPAKPLNQDYQEERGGPADLTICTLESVPGATSICVWSSPIQLSGGAKGDYDIIFSRRILGESVWSMPAYLNTDAQTDTADDGSQAISTWGGPVLASAGEGRWVCAWNRRDLALGAVYGSDWDIMYATSDTDGQTWSIPRVLNHNAGFDPEGAGGLDFNPFLSASGAEVLAAWGTSTFALPGCPATSIAVSRSTDGGLTWSATGPLNQNAGRNPSGSHQDPFIANDGAGHWVITWVTTQAEYSGAAGDFDNLSAWTSNTNQGLDPPAEVSLTIQSILDMILGRTVFDANADGRIDMADVIYLQTSR